MFSILGWNRYVYSPLTFSCAIDAFMAGLHRWYFIIFLVLVIPGNFTSSHCYSEYCIRTPIYGDARGERVLPGKSGSDCVCMQSLLSGLFIFTPYYYPGRSPDSDSLQLFLRVYLHRPATRTSPEQETQPSQHSDTPCHNDGKQCFCRSFWSPNT